jgi:8-oxo-dGTP pyrophosphatase MutT (NUDIX family)
MCQRAAAAVIEDAEGRVLLARHAYGRLRWSLPSGRVDPGEEPEQTVVREVLEEVGLVVVVRDLVGVYAVTRRSGARRYVHGFRCDVVGEEQARIVDPLEISEVAWVTPPGPPWPETPSGPAILADALAGLRGVERDVGRD